LWLGEIVADESRLMFRSSTSTILTPPPRRSGGRWHSATRDTWLPGGRRALYGRAAQGKEGPLVARDEYVFGTCKRLDLEQLRGWL
jgi:hypothetical protein